MQRPVLVGEYDFTLDAKNRIAVPARLRPAFGEGIYVAERWSQARGDGDAVLRIQREVVLPHQDRSLHGRHSTPLFPTMQQYGIRTPHTVALHTTTPAKGDPMAGVRRTSRERTAAGRGAAKRCAAGALLERDDDPVADDHRAGTHVGIEGLDLTRGGVELAGDTRERVAALHDVLPGRSRRRAPAALGLRHLWCRRHHGLVGAPEDARLIGDAKPVSYTHLRAHETDSYLVCRLLLEKKKK